ncbi:MAG: Bug family tripartite tricarboxylate transporter substrate binding protein [Beijerinckiaceae bacterium]
MNRRQMIAALIASTGSAIAAGNAPALAQGAWPSKPVTVVVPFAAGGNTDVMARIFADHLGKRLGQNFIIENRAGAGGVTGLNAAAKAAPDGYTIAVSTSGGIAINPVLVKDKMPYDASKDFTYLYGMAAMPNLIVVHPSVPANNMAELTAWLKANPGTPYATSGVGSTQHFCGELLSLRIGAPMTAVPYRSSSQFLQDIVGGQIKLACDNYATAWEQVQGGKVRAIAMTSRTPYALAKDVETVASTLPDFELLTGFGWVGPAGIPPDVAKRISDELIAVGKLPEVRAAMEKFGVLQTELDGPAYAAAMAKDRAGYAELVEKAGIKAP